MKNKDVHIVGKELSSYDIINIVKDEYFKHGLTKIYITDCIIKMTRPKKFSSGVICPPRPWYIPKFAWKKAEIATFEGYPVLWMYWKDCTFWNTHRDGGLFKINKGHLD